MSEFCEQCDAVLPSHADSCRVPRDDLRADRDRLRTALKALLDLWDSDDDPDDVERDVLIPAREALKDGEG